MLILTNMKSRPYRMEARAAAAEATHERILDAVFALFGERFLDEITLDAVAERAGVAVQTVIRHFGSRAGLVAAAAERLDARLWPLREAAAPDDAASAVEALLRDYEQWGALTLRALAQEERAPELRPHLARGREQHRAWVRHTFAASIERRRGRARALLEAKLVAVCDVYVWKVLRRDLRLSEAETRRALVELVDAILRGER